MKKPVLANSLSFSEGVQRFVEYMEVANLSPTTIDAYESNLSFLGRYLGTPEPVSLRDIDEAMMVAYLGYLRVRPRRFADKGRHTERISDSYYETTWRRLKRFFTWCVTKGYVEENPMAGIPRPRMREKLVDVIKDEYIHRMILLTKPSLYVPGTATRFRAVRDHAVMWIFVDTPVRRAELTRLRLQDLDMDERRFKVMGKGRKERVQFLGSTAIKALNLYLEARAKLYPSTDDLWVDDTGGPLGSAWIYFMVKRLAERAEVPGGVHPHQFRHTCAMKMALSGIPQYALEQLCGWERIPKTYLRAIRAGAALRARSEVSPGDVFAAQGNRALRRH